MRDSSEWLGTTEAAELLGVSEASIRRWSDRGVLRGRRVGARRERRFRVEDVRRLKPSRGVKLPVPVKSGPIVAIGATTVNDHAHVATFYDTDAGRLRVAVPFLAEGLRNGARCFLMAHGPVRNAYFQALTRSEGVDVDQALSVGALRVYQGPGSTIGEALEFWESAFWESIAEGASMTRVVGEAASVRDQFKSESDMLAFEAALNLTAKRFPCVFICQYDVRQFSGQALLSVLRAHPDLYTQPMSPFLLS